MTFDEFTLYFYVLCCENGCEEYQDLYRVYLDEYPEQQVERLLFFNKRWNLKSNQGIKRTA